MVHLQKSLLNKKKLQNVYQTISLFQYMKTSNYKKHNKITEQ